MKRWLLLTAVILAAGSLIRVAHSSRRVSARVIDSPSPASAPASPAGCQRVPPGAALDQALDAARAGTALCLEPGSYGGPVHIRRSVTLWGPREAVIRSAGEGTTIEVASDDVHLAGFTVRGSGDRFDRNDSAIRIRGANVRVEGVMIEKALFGITAEESHDIVLQRNKISGDPAHPFGLRGDAIRLWQTTGALVEGNTITHGRDILIWYSTGIRVLDNLITSSRYGTHFMYSKEATVKGNRYLGNLVGIFLMYSRGLTAESNVIQDSNQPDGMGIGNKDSVGMLCRNNLIVRNTIGAYIDVSPANSRDANRLDRNLFALNGTAVVFHASERNTAISDNSFRGNQSLVAVEGSGDAVGVRWESNYFDDYQGYDLNHDGRGDVPYELRSLSNELTSSYPELKFFQGSPALAMLDSVSHVFPLFDPKLILSDPSPRMTPPNIEVAQSAN